MAPRRSVPKEQWPPPLPLACSGDVLDILVQSRRNKKAAKKFFRKLLKGLRYVPAHDHYRQAEELQRGQDRSDAECRTSPAKVSEQSSGEFASADEIAREGDEAVQVGEPGAAFLSAFGIITSHFRVGRHLYRASSYREVMKIEIRRCGKR